MNALFNGWEPWHGPIQCAPTPPWSRTAKASDRPMRSYHLQERGVIFIAPGTKVYEGMVVGEYSRDDDLNVNICREKKLTNMRAAGKRREHHHLAAPGDGSGSGLGMDRRRRIGGSHAAVRPTQKKNFATSRPAETPARRTRELSPDSATKRVFYTRPKSVRFCHSGKLESRLYIFATAAAGRPAECENQRLFFRRRRWFVAEILFDKHHVQPGRRRAHLDRRPSACVELLNLRVVPCGP